MRGLEFTRFFMRAEESGYVYCSNCGKKIPDTRLSRQSHSRKCYYGKAEVKEILTESSRGYEFLKLNEETLRMAVYAPVMTRCYGMKDVYTGGRWLLVYQARFHWNSRQVEESVEGELSKWIRMLEKGELVNLGEQEPEEVISSVFPVIPSVYSLGMFCHIYVNKGYRVSSWKPSAQLLAKYCACRQQELDTCKAAGYDSLFFRTYVYGDLVKDAGNTFLAVRAYWYAGIWKCFSFLAGEGVLWITGAHEGRRSLFERLWNGRMECRISPEVLDAFDKENPSFGLQNYLKGGGEKVILPILCGANYHKGIELLAKSGMSWYADHYFIRDVRADFSDETGYLTALFDKGKEPDPAEYTDVPSLLGIPVGMLRHTSPGLLSDEENRRRLSDVYGKKRNLLEGVPINDSVVMFLKDIDVTNDRSVRSRIRGLKHLTDAQLRHILLYLSELDSRDYRLYLDYLEMMRLTRIEHNGYWPKNLEEAHDELAAAFSTDSDRIENNRFREAVEAYSYLEFPERKNKKPSDVREAAPEAGTTDETSRTAESGKEMRARLKEAMNHEPYCIIVPRDIAALNKEGINQHNCVATYREQIIDRMTKILFLRRKARPDESLVTIEAGDKRIYQAKAAYNRRAENECQRFICMWCEYNGLLYDACDDITWKGL